MIKPWIRKQIAEWWISNRPKQIKANDLTFIGVDANGKRYYSWSEFDQIPKCRISELQSFALFDDMKLTHETLSQIISACHELLEKSLVEKDAKKKTKMHAQLFALLEEITWRAQHDTPIDIVTNMAAILAVREDENPNKFSATTHDEKVEQFKTEERNGNFFFTMHKAFNQLKPSLAMSAEEWKQHYSQEIFRQIQNDTRLKTIFPGKSSESEKKQTTK